MNCWNHINLLELFWALHVAASATVKPRFYLVKFDTLSDK